MLKRGAFERRDFLRLSAGASLGATLVRSPGEGRIVIIGGGIIGASICYRLARRGAEVTLIERVGPAAGATGASFAWINASFTKQPRDYYDLNRHGVDAFRALHQELGPELSVVWSGTIEWYANAARAAELRRMVQIQQAWGYPISFIEPPALARLEPRVRFDVGATATLAETEGHVDAAAATRLLLRRAQAAGARIIHPCNVERIISRADHYLLRTTEGEITGSTLVLACGIETERMAAMAGVSIPLVPAPGIVMRTTPQPAVIRHLLVTEDVHLRRQIDGRVVIGDDYGPPATPAHQPLATQPADFSNRQIALRHGRRMLAAAARHVPSVAGVPIESVRLCWRPMPRDSYPVIGFAGPASAGRRLYVAVTHSGVTLGPLFGRLATAEILDGVEVDLLAPYRPGRFLSG